MKSNTLTIEKMVNGGYGLARTSEGRVVFVPGSLPGEVVTCSRFEQRKQTLFATPGEILHHHPGRIPPPCPYYGSCGGCNLQHCDYRTQLAIKDQILDDLLDNVFQRTHSCVPSPREFGYRQRIRLQIEKNRFGFKRFRSNEMIGIQACLLAHEPINSVLDLLLKDTRCTTLCENSREVEFLFNPASAQVTLLFHCRRKPRPAELKAATDLVLHTENLESIYFVGTDFSRLGPYPDTTTAKDGSHLSHLFNHTGAPQPFRLSWEIGGFCQVNLPQNERLIKHVMASCSPDRDSRILDLFCGMGNFSIPLAQIAGSLVGVEGQGASIRMARKNSAAAGLANVAFSKGDIGAQCDKLIAAGERFDTILVDPPRQGITGLWPKLARLTDQRLVYVSCDPATLVRDMKKLSEYRFQPVSLVPFDMFPQTHHIETVTVFKKNCCVL